MTTISWQRIAFAALSLAGAAAAQTGTPTVAPAAPPPLPIESFFARPEMAQPRLSPSGRWLAALMRGTPQRNLLMLVDLDAPGKPTVLARFADVDIGNVRWVGDDYLVFDVVDLQAGSGERDRAPGLFSVHRDGTGLRELVKLRASPMVDSRSATDRRLDYNHLLLHVPRGGDNEVIVGELRFHSGGGIESVLPRRLNVVTGRSRGIAAGVPDSAQRWLFDATGEPRIAVSTRAGRSRVYWRAPSQADWALIGEFDALTAPWSPHSVDAAGALFVTVPSGAGGTRVLSRFDFAAGKPHPMPQVSTPGFDFAGSLVSEFEGGRTLGVRVNTDAESTVWHDARLKALQDDADTRLPGRVNRLSCRRCDGDDIVLLIESWSDRDPGSYWVRRGPSQRLELLGRRLKQIDPQRMATVGFERVAARDGRDLPVWVTLPAQAKRDAALPAVVLVHGGPWVRGGAWAWRPMSQFLASRGYVVIEPEFRGSTGFGSEHFKAGWRQWGQAMQDDVADAVIWAAREKLIDPARVCIAGSSYGGYATLMGLVRHPELYRCGAAWLAVTEPMRLLERSWWWGDDISDEARRYSLPTLMGDTKADAEMLKAASPLQQAARIRSPVLLAYGELDRRVPLVHGNEMRDALKLAGREPEWIVYPTEGHGWQKLETQHDFARRLEAFLERHLK